MERQKIEIEGNGSSAIRTRGNDLPSAVRAQLLDRAALQGGPVELRVLDDVVRDVAEIEDVASRRCAELEDDERVADRIGGQRA